MPALVEFIDVSCYGSDGRALFENVSLTLNAGDNLAVAAPMASGKSLILKLMAGLARPDKGLVRVFGKDTSSLGADEMNGIRARMGMIFKDTVLISNLKVIENVLLPLLYHSELSHAECMDRARALLGLVGFRGEEWGLPGGLPIYTKKLITVARALAMGPEILLCENLMDGLMDEEKKTAAAVVLGYLSSGARLLVSTTTDESDLARLKPERVLKIQDGRLVG